MVLKRIAYALILAASVVTFILTDSGIALFFFLSIAAFPLLSFIMLCFAKRKLKYDFSVRPSCMRGNALQITVNTNLLPRFLAGFLAVTCEIENTTFGNIDRQEFSFKDLLGKTHKFNYISDNSGRVTVRFTKVRITDIFGLWAFNVKCGKSVEAIVSPVLYDLYVRMGTSSKTASAGEVAVSKRGADNTETSGIRDYVPGDMLNSVHWKLSGKFDDIKIKEYGITDDRRTLILVDLTRAGKDASDEKLNCVLDIAVSVSYALLKGGYAHKIGWFNDGIFFCSEVSGNDTFLQTVEKLMSVNVSKTTEDRIKFLRSAECAAFTKIVYVAAGVDIAEVRNYASYFDFTALSVADEASVLDEGSFKFVSIPESGITSVISSCEL